MRHPVWCGRHAWCQARSSWRARCAAAHSSARPSGSPPAAPSAWILLGRHVIPGLQMPLQHLELLAVLQTDDVLRRDGLLDRNRGLRLFRLLGRRYRREVGETPVDLPNQLGKVGHGDGVVGNVRCHNFGGQRKELLLAHLFSHSALRPLRAGLVSCHPETYLELSKAQAFFCYLAKMSQESLEQWPNRASTSRPRTWPLDRPRTPWCSGTRRRRLAWAQSAVGELRVSAPRAPCATRAAART